MSEQLWYTWSASGFGMTTAGFRVRAASQGFMGTKGFVDMQGEHFLTLMKYLNYDLPVDASNLLDVVPEQAPRSLVFVQAGQERILVNKVYTGLDGVGRPGVFFSHLLTDLPRVPSSCPDKQLPFSAREAIDLWGSSLWKDSEKGFDPNQLELSQVSNGELAVGPLSARNMAQMAESLLYVIQAFLMLPTLGEQKRLYIAASPDIVATLIWGLTHALPRTLHIMRTLTFSTYERDIEEKILSLYGQQTAEKALPVIVGTCWLSHSTQDLPAIYYQEQNPYGLALNCYLPDRKTPLAAHPLVSAFAQFAMQCFVSGKMKNLRALINEAEKRDITEVHKFLELYTSFKDNLPKDDIVNIIKALYAKMKALLEKAVKALREGKILPEDERQQWKSIQSEVDILKQENVRNSIIDLLTNEPSWWQEQGKDLIQPLQKLADCYTDSELSMLRVAFTQAFNSNIRGRKGQHTALPTTFADQITGTLRMTQNALATALLPLISDFAEQIAEAIWGNDDVLTSSWGDILATCMPVRTRMKADVWAYLLQQLSKMRYTPVYQHWWTQYGKTTVREISTLLHTQPDSELDQAYSSFIDQAVQELLGAIKSEEGASLSFWQEVLGTTAPDTSRPDVWLNLLLNLCPVMDSQAYQRWWQVQGRGVAHSLRQLAERDPLGEMAKKLSSYANNVANILYARMIDKTSKTPLNGYIRLLLTIIVTVIHKENTTIWPYVLQKLSMGIHGRIDEMYSWELRSLCLETWANTAILEKDQYIHRDWLAVHWNELDQLLSLKLPDDWYKVSITKVLLSITPSDLARVDFIATVTYHSRLFEEVLVHLMKVSATEQEAAKSFFALLAQCNYSRRFPLLDRLLEACQYRADVTEVLLASLHLATRRDVVDLLEHHCKIVLSEHEITPTLDEFVQQYLNDFDPDYLDTDPTRELLQRLLKRSERTTLRLQLNQQIQRSIETWCNIAEFIKSPGTGKNRLRNLCHGTRKMTRLSLDTRSKLADKLMPHLVESAATEIDLGRVIDNLGKVLVGESQGGVSVDLLLLERMAKIAGEKYGQERPPLRIAPYIKVVLDESALLPPVEKKSFVDRCLNDLLKQIDRQTRDTFTANPMLWPNDIVAEWKDYLYRSSLAAINEGLNHFRNALKSRDMFGIVAAHDPSLDGHLQTQEQNKLELARRFVAAYQANDDAALVEVNDTIIKSPYHKQLDCTRAQGERIKLAQSRMLAASQSTALIVAPNVHVQIPAPPPQSLPQEIPASKEPIIAKVKGQTITLEWFKQVLQLKEPYTQDRIRDLRQTIQRLEESHPDHATRQANKWRKSELKELAKLLSNRERLREATLDNLVDDVLIREAIEKLIRQDPTNRGQWFDMEADLLGILDRLRIQQVHNYPFLISYDLHQILEILRIFRRHELFATYLIWNDKGILPDWLKKQRDHEKTEIAINYDLAEVKPPKNKKAGLLNWLPADPRSYP